MIKVLSFTVLCNMDIRTNKVSQAHRKILLSFIYIWNLKNVYLIETESKNDKQRQGKGETMEVAVIDHKVMFQLQ